nr:hypothetical transcript [Hymenolepis microstoma]
MYSLVEENPRLDNISYIIEQLESCLWCSRVVETPKHRELLFDIAQLIQKCGKVYPKLIVTSCIPLVGRVWTQAAVQLFSSLGPAWRGLTTLSFYNYYECKYIELDWDDLKAVNDRAGFSLEQHFEKRKKTEAQLKSA